MCQIFIKPEICFDITIMCKPHFFGVFIYICFVRVRLFCSETLFQLGTMNNPVHCELQTTNY